MLLQLMLEANWNRPLIALLMILIAVVACFGIWALTKIKSGGGQ